MNRKLLEKIADWLERGAPHAEARGMAFDMTPIVSIRPDQVESPNWCGTACCIMGAALVFDQPNAIIRKLKESPTRMERNWPVSLCLWDEGTVVLGIHGAMASLLFSPHEQDPETLLDLFDDAGIGIADNEPPVLEKWPEYAEDISPAWAARTVRRLLDKGDVRWDLTADSDYWRD
jgi:hypothetical protein